MTEDNYRVCFIIAHRYYRNYESDIQYYVDNIQKYYKNSFTIIVDNNSKYIDDIKQHLYNYSNLVILSNETACKFEIGAYKVGINYLIDNNLVNVYDYVIFSQDNFVLTNKYDFNLLKDDGIKGCALGMGDSQHHYEHFYETDAQIILKMLGLENLIDKIGLVWCASFILHNSKLLEFLNITKDIIITIRHQSCCSERYLAAILYYFNDSKNRGLYDITNLHYDCWTVDIKNNNYKYCFMKRVQQKNQDTLDK
jgi:hypothetical protein